MKTLLATIQGSEIWLYTDESTGQEIVRFTADMDIDCDGSGGNPNNDPYFQPDTRLHFRGRPLHAELIPYIVVPPIILAKTKGKVLGSSCLVSRGKRSCFAVVGDSGPRAKVGEGSPALARALGLNDNPNHGGTSEFEITYEIEVGKPAVVSVTFDLQSA